MGADMIYASESDRERLAALIAEHGLTRCDLCEHASMNAGYDLPYCLKRTELNQGSGGMGSSVAKGKPPYRLKIGSIPKICGYWLSKAECRAAREHQALEKERTACRNRLAELDDLLR